MYFDGFISVCNYAKGHGSNNCTTVQQPSCPEPGSVATIVGDHCVPEYQCVCDTASSACPLAPNCSDIEYLHTEEGECCPEYECSKCHFKDDTVFMHVV